MAKVTVTINPKTNEVKYEVEGMPGGACADLTKQLMQANEVLEYQETSEMCEVEELPDYVIQPKEEE